MGVVIRYADSARDPSVAPAPVIPSAQITGRIRSLCGTVELLTGDSATSKIVIGALPSNAILKPDSKLYYDALTGLTSLGLGDAAHPAALVSALDVHLGGSASAVSAVDIANLTKPLWQVLGFAADPGGSIELVATVGADVGAGGTLLFDLHWAFD